MSVIQQIPPGLLSLLGIQSGGQNPQQLAGVVTPTMDMLGWYTASVLRTVGGAGDTITGNGVFTAAALTVPSGEWWYLIDGHARVSCAAATQLTATAHWLIQRGAGAASVYATPDRRANVAAETLTLPFPSGIWLPPAAAPRLFVSGFAGSNSPWTLDLVYAPLRA